MVRPYGLLRTFKIVKKVLEIFRAWIMSFNVSVKRTALQTDVESKIGHEVANIKEKQGSFKMRLREAGFTVYGSAYMKYRLPSKRNCGHARHR